MGDSVGPRKYHLLLSLLSLSLSLSLFSKERMENERKDAMNDEGGRRVAVAKNGVTSSNFYLACSVLADDVL